MVHATDLGAREFERANLYACAGPTRADGATR